MPTKTLSGRDPGLFPYLVLSTDGDEATDPTDAWDAGLGVFGDYTGAAYESGAGPYTDLGGGDYLINLAAAVPNYAAIPAGVYRYRTFLRQTAGPDRLIDAPYLIDAGEVAIGVAGARAVALAWGLPAPAAQDIRLAAGEDIRLAFAALADADPAGVGAAVAFACRHPLTGAVALAADAADIDPVAGTFAADLAAADTALLDPLLTYRWDAYRTGLGAAARLAHGTLRAAARQ